MKKNLYLLEQIAPCNFIIVLDNKNLTIGHIFDRGILKQDTPRKGTSSYRIIKNPDVLFARRNLTTPVCFVTKRGEICANAKISYHLTPHHNYNYYLVLYGINVQNDSSCNSSSDSIRNLNPDVHCFEKLFYKITNVNTSLDLVNLATRASRFLLIARNTAIGSLFIVVLELASPYIEKTFIHFNLLVQKEDSR